VKGTISEEKWTEFKMPVYLVSPEEVKGSGGGNGGAAYKLHRRKFCKSRRVNFPLESR